MDDLISRQAAIDALRNVCDRCTIGDKLYDAIIALPSAQPEPQWILCSERLPGCGEDVLLSIAECCNVGYLVPTNDEMEFNWFFSGWYHPLNDVDAWMPLPEPYAKGREE